VAAAHAALRTLELSGGQRVHAEVLQLLVDAVARGRGQAGPAEARAEEGTAEDDDDEAAAEATLLSLAALGGVEEAGIAMGADGADELLRVTEAADAVSDVGSEATPSVAGWEEDAGVRQRSILVRRSDLTRASQLPCGARIG